jgi:hypothetical protein
MVLSSETIAVVATWNVAASSAYYVRGAEYYLGSREPEGVWYAPPGMRRVAISAGAMQQRSSRKNSPAL